MEIESNRLPEGPLPRSLADRFMAVVRWHAYRLARRLPSHISVDDLIGAGCVGLADALKRFDRSGPARFETYATFRIRGAMLDELRSRDVMSRDLRDLNKRVVAAVRSLTADLGRPPDETEIAQRLNLTTLDFHDQLARLSIGGVVSLDTGSRDDDGAIELGDEAAETGEAWTLRSERQEQLAVALEQLPERLQRILKLYYHKDFCLREIGLQLGLTESRVCQLHGAAIARMRAVCAEDARFDEFRMDAPPPAVAPARKQADSFLRAG